MHNYWTNLDKADVTDLRQNMNDLSSGRLQQAKICALPFQISSQDVEDLEAESGFRMADKSESERGL